MDPLTIYVVGLIVFAFGFFCHELAASVHDPDEMLPSVAVVVGLIWPLVAVLFCLILLGYAGMGLALLWGHIIDHVRLAKQRN